MPDSRGWRAGLRAAALGHGFQALADLILAAEIFEPRKWREVLEPEHSLEEQSRPVADGSAGAVVLPRLRDQAALDSYGVSTRQGDEQEGCVRTTPRCLRPAAATRCARSD
jgi:hypothetical protein